MAIQAATWGEAVKAGREAKGWTQTEFGARVRVSYSTVQKWEANAQEPRLSQAMRVAKAFGWSRAALLAFAERTTRAWLSRKPSGVAA